jgi:hypothetical protein
MGIVNYDSTYIPWAYENAPSAGNMVRMTNPSIYSVSGQNWMGMH